MPFVLLTATLFNENGQSNTMGSCIVIFMLVESRGDIKISERKFSVYQVKGPAATYLYIQDKKSPVWSASFYSVKDKKNARTFQHQPFPTGRSAGDILADSYVVNTACSLRRGLPSFLDTTCFRERLGSITPRKSRDFYHAARNRSGKMMVFVTARKEVGFGEGQEEFDNEKLIKNSSF
ncbi:hypothetical protein SUGI_0178530 [Cryptomeria japonica]|nr:hypothetical protein SUGI_0178530 [Cryptomeria japonica]